MPNLPDMLKDKRLGLVTTPAARLAVDTSAEAFLMQAGDVGAFLALEHGLRGELQDGVTVDSYTDPLTRCPVFSFYGKEKTVPADFLAGIDLAVFCVQDVSHRAYTFKQALTSLLEKAEATGTPVLIIDRPTPLAHLGSRGPLNTQFFPLDLPVVIPYTLGELGLWLAAEKNLHIDLQVFPVPHWTRNQMWNIPAVPWIPPSPNIPTLDSAYAYLATGLFQATSISEGRGTCKPFEYFGAPGIDPFSWCRDMRALNLPGVAWREIYFKPVGNKYANQVCGGLQLMITAHREFRPMETSLHLLQTLCRLYGEIVQFADNFPDWLDGTPITARHFADMDIGETLSAWQIQCANFDDRLKPHTLY